MGHAVSAPAIAFAAESSGPTDYELRVAAASRAWDAARANSMDPVVALRAVVAACSHQLSTEQDLEHAARLGEALAREFDATNRTQTIADKTAALRVAEGAIKAVIELRKVPETAVILPFLTVTPNGPVHLDVRVTRAKLAELDAMGVYVVQEAAAPAPEGPTPGGPVHPKPARKWWPFG
jgi:hypothetical protein